MAERQPPDDGDDLFEWTDAPGRPLRPREPEGTGEGEAGGASGRERPGTGEHERPGTGEREPTESSGRPSSSTGERRSVRGDTGDRQRVRGDTGEYERSGRRPPPGRRERHRDLPARIRRRQAGVIGLVALVLVIALVSLVSGGGDDDGEEPLAVKRLVGQAIVAQLGGGAPDQALLQRARRGQLGGVVVEAESAEVVQAGVETLQRAAVEGGNPPLLVLIDQEGGPVKRLADGPPDTAPRELGAAEEGDAAREEGERTAEFLRGLGVTVDLAPVLDVSQPQTANSIKVRTFGDDPGLVADVGVSFAEGLQDAGVAATAKHFPGLGRAQVSTDERPVSIAATSQDLEAELEPFREAIDAGVELVMVSSASYPTLGSKQQAVFSPAIVQGLLRDELGFEGIVITDDLQAPAVASVTPGVAAVNAIKAGDDLLLYAGTGNASVRAFNAVVSQVKSGALDRGLLESAHERIIALKQRLSG
ncbi:MAG TPA: glycoside hydrolase family 3 N-terminal domain-containing protein [Solirubrobacterales bacterium]|nr:glycoside hydrolase family 3 N-terminal domain-containing protein [Solirubrobacterales bacterium]